MREDLACKHARTHVARTWGCGARSFGSLGDAFGGLETLTLVF